jgi:hypothetical protein
VPVCLLCLVCGGTFLGLGRLFERSSAFASSLLRRRLAYVCTADDEPAPGEAEASSLGEVRRLKAFRDLRAPARPFANVRTGQERLYALQHQRQPFATRHGNRCQRRTRTGHLWRLKNGHFD